MYHSHWTEKYACAAVASPVLMRIVTFLDASGIADGKAGSSTEYSCTSEPICQHVGAVGCKQRQLNGG